MSAIFSDCRNFRYRLDRVLGDGPPLAFLLHNPSTAGEVADDATSRRGIGFARSLGFGRLIFINPWAKIATSPRDLWMTDDPVGPLNDIHIAQAIREVEGAGGKIVGAWGRVSPPAKMRDSASRRLSQVVQIVIGNASKFYALGTNVDGSPKHPLYVRADATLSLWKGGDSHLL